jgi:homoserine dehydrogenase
MSKLNIGLFGFGCVAQGFYQGLQNNPDIPVSIKKICVRDLSKKRSIDGSLFTADPSAILDDGSIDIVIELISDSDAAFRYISEALKRGKRVISANKKAIAENLPQLVELQQKNGGTLLYEAAVGGAIPILNSLDLFFNGQEIRQIRGILNGTCNFILTKMKREGISFEKALTQAQAAGFAEENPYLDISGYDALYKSIILSYHAFGTWCAPADIAIRGIDGLSSSETLQGRKENQKIKLISSIVREKKNVAIEVKPTILTEEDNLYGIDFEKNAVEIESSFSGRHIFQGNGAGSYPTGSAVLNDLKLLLDGFEYKYKKPRLAWAS